MNEVVLSVRNLNLSLHNGTRLIHVLHDISFDVARGKTIGIVGESGSGKTQTMLSIMKLLPNSAVLSGEVLYKGVNLIRLSESELNRYRWNSISIAFQDPMTALNPYMTIKQQLIEPLIVHKHMKQDQAITEALRVLDAVRIPDAKSRINFYPHEFSGGMKQRVMIAMALICKPEILIADELTTALDVTVQAQIIKLLKELQNDIHMSILFISHDLGILSKIADEVVVMYCGCIMEHNTARSLFHKPMHPYTKSLINAIPRLNDDVEELKTIPGEPPILDQVAGGCPFAPRCSIATDICFKDMPNTQYNGEHTISCFNVEVNK